MRTRIGSRFKSDERGFTLVEIILSIVILGVLATALVMRGLDLSNTAQAGACRANQVALESAQLMYYAQAALAGNGAYPSTLSELTPYLIEESTPECPDGGTYQIHDDGAVTCTIGRHSR